jgi:predicted histone-like DNA-binding protein
MAVFFKKIQRADPRNPTGIKKWYIILKSLGTRRTKEIAQRMADETTMNPKEAEIGLYQFVKVLKIILKEGYTAQIDDFGTFYLTTSSSASETEKDTNAHNCTGIHLSFRPDAAFQAEINKVQLKPIDEL